MISVRLPKDLEEKLELYALKQKVTKTEIIKKALAEYMEKNSEEKSPYELVENLFGKYGSGQGDLSVKYKKKVREKIDTKMSH